MTLSLPLLLIIAVAVCDALALVGLALFVPHRWATISPYEGQVNEPGPAALEKFNKELLLVEYGRSFSLVLFIVLVLRSFPVEPFRILSGSMKPTLEVGDFILVNKFAYDICLSMLNTKVVPIGDPQRGDAMMFRYSNEPNINYIKRVVGLPDDAVHYTREKRPYVNGELTTRELVGEEPGTLDSVTLYQEELSQAEHLIHKEVSRCHIESSRQWTIPTSYYFMMGDSRGSSDDSRYWNDPKIPKDLLDMIPNRSIVGKAFAVWMS